MKKTLLFIVLLAIFAPFAMQAQQALPYEYGFEASLANAGWTLTNASNSGITNNSTAVQSGSYGFMFSYQDEGAYLMSPILTGGDRGIVLSFFFKAYSGSYPDHFKVGYTTDATVTDPSEFTYGSQVTSSNAWQEYTETLPAGTVRMAVFYDDGNYDDGYYLFLDDFSFEAYSSCAKPTDLTINYTTGETRAIVEWRGEASAYNVMVNGISVSEGQTETSYTINGIELVNNYTVSVQADCGEEQSSWVSETFFSGCTENFAIPYAYGFESTADINCWTLSPEDNMVIESDPDIAHSGDNFFTFSYTQDPPQYLISPELSGIVNGLHVEFYYSQYTQGEEIFHVGYSTTDNDPESFTWGEEINATSSYQRFSANYPAETKYVAIKHTSNYQWYLFLDDFLFEESASCLEPTNVLQYGEVTTTGANIDWTAGGEETAWDIYVTNDYNDVPDETTTPTVANTTSNTYELTALTPATTYYVYVRAICGTDEVSAWSSPATFNTLCEGMALPYTEDFENDLTVCWTIINSNTSYNNIGINTLPHNGDYALGFNSQTNSGNLIAVLPEVDGTTYPLNNAQVSFWVRHYSSSSYASANPFAIGIMTDPNDASTFVQIGETITPTSTYTQYTVRLNSYTSYGQYIAFKSTPNSTSNVWTFIDDIEVSVLPSCLEPENLAVSGGMNAVVTWEGTAASFDVALATSEVADPADYIVGNTAENEFDLSNYTSAGMNYVYVRANCGTNGYSEWIGTSFDVNYCTPAPSTVDNNGISNVTFGTGDYVVNNDTPKATYADYTNEIGAVSAGVESTIAITFATGYTYNTFVWVDLDNSLSFEAEEVVCYGESTNSNPTTLTLNFTIPATQTLGDYRMRIGSADNGLGSNPTGANPCYTGTYACFQDYTLRVLEAPSCLAAGDVTVDPTNITSTSAVISWTNQNGADATYTVMQGTTVLTTTAVNSYLLEGLTSATTYPAGTFTIISDCDETAVANVPAFTTTCDDITTLPWSEDFESYSNNTVPMCWDNSASTTSTVSGTNNYYVWGVYNYDDNNMIRMENYWVQSGIALINTPTIVLPSEGAYQLSFDYAHNASCGAFKVNVSEDNGATWIELGSYTKGSGSSHTEPGDFTPATISLADYAGKSIILQFFANANYGNGAIFVDNIEVKALTVPTFEKTIAAYTDNSGYYLIASPVGNDLGLTPATEVTNLVDGSFDLYMFDQTGDDDGKQWLNYKANAFSTLEMGLGYLYANSETVILTFTGTPIDTDEDFMIEVIYDAGSDFPGLNLLGNPFAEDAYLVNNEGIGLAYHRLDPTTNTYVTVDDNSAIAMMEGVFYEANAAGQVFFSTTVPTTSKSNLNITVSQGRGMIDNAIVRFGEGNTLTKISFRDNSTKVYIPQNGKEYALVNATEFGEMPVNFKAENNGTYTLSFSNQNIEFSYLHLIDNLTGNNIDLLANPSYSFEANTTDYSSRFRLAFATGNAISDNEFAFVSNGNVIVNGEGTLQVIDMSGRIVSTNTINGVSSINLNAAAGVYVLQLTNGSDVKTQKIVVK